MKEIKFNIPLKDQKYFRNLIKFVKSKKSLHGPGENIHKTKKKLNDIFGFKYVHLTNSCTSALEMSALLLNLKHNSEIVVPSYAFMTTASSFVRAGYKIRYCDIEKRTLMPSFNQIKKCVTRKTRAIVIVHYQGFSVNYLDKHQKFCKKKRIFLIEDAAQALGSYFKKKPLGTFGDFGCFSFHHTKNLHSGIGGLIVINNKNYRKKSDFVFEKGTDRSLVINDKQKYYSWVNLGSSFLLSELHASFLLPQINDLKEIIKLRSKIYNRYISNFNKWLDDEFIICNEYIYKYNYHSFVIVLKKNIREKFLNFLKTKKIIAFIGYKSLHTSQMGKKFLQKKQKLKITDMVENKIVRLPLHNNLSLKEVDYISQNIKRFFLSKI